MRIVLWLFIAVSILGCGQGERQLEWVPCLGHHNGIALAMSGDGETLAVSANGADPADDSSLITLLNAKSGYFTGVSARTTQHVEQIEFVSNDFGFLLGRSIDPKVARRNDWPIVPASLERFGLDGTRQVIVDAIHCPISSIAISADGKLVSVCTKMLSDQGIPAECRIYSLEDGKLLSKVGLRSSSMLIAVFVGKSENCLIACQPHQGYSRCYLVSARSGKTLQESDLASSNFEIYGLSSAPESNEAYLSGTGVIWQFIVDGPKFRFEKFYSQSAFGAGGIQAKSIAFDAERKRLAVYETQGGSYHRSATRIIDTTSRIALRPIAGVGGPMRFSPDGQWLFGVASPVRKVHLQGLH